MTYYGLDPASYLTVPGLAWDAMFLMTHIELELIHDVFILQMIEKIKLGGLCDVGSKRHVKVNNKYIRDELDKVARDANSTIYGLSGSVWTRDIGTAMQMVRKIDSGQVSVNMHAAIDPAMPFGGNKQSGWGREFGKEGLEPYLKTKGVTVTW